jgi:23S rRNA pseudouridine2604 synthase
MCEYLGYEVTALKRIRIINISLDVPVGRYRELTPAEIKELNTLIEPSSKTEEASLPKPEARPDMPRNDFKRSPGNSRNDTNRNRRQNDRRNNGPGN